MVHQLGAAAGTWHPPLRGHQLPQHQDLHRDQEAEEGPEAAGGPDVRGADADSGRVHRVQPAQAPPQPPRDHRHPAGQQVTANQDQKLLLWFSAVYFDFEEKSE